MAGHSKWANIKHRKAAQDAKRGKIFTRLIREIVVAAREGGGDPDTNPRLRAAIDKALANNMKKDTVDTAIKRGSGDLEGDNLDELTYEGYGPGGVAILLETMTDNRNRTVSEVRYAFSKHGGNLGTDGSVAYLFNKRGVLSFPAETDEDELMAAALEAGAEDFVTNDDGSFDVFTTPETFGAVKDGLAARGFEAVHAEVGLMPETRSLLAEEADAEKFLKLIDALEELDDVQEVYHNADIADDILERIS
ncbi:YebC/PmpR family DNA-binding transcriptional regulator [Pseudidiomarina halophila]|uniref:Probable transcriptional regulatory protein CWI69_00675 n=1 Tax=Pseudidiomarina halophila TaxID=1449799 RepID=A0A432XZ40_9GAMM|nr:YebC/PmpR family DNA-binding transcriptional regulator [Pseudidiomarina halophila]RUO53986.1 YebC/PmpR family DNA-binding transcriptional regulator [Pseudidiomarina halophila]